LETEKIKETNMKKQEKIDALLDEMGAVGSENGGRWHGYKVIVPKFEKNEKIGLPLVILVGLFRVRLSTNDECLAYTKSVNNR
jgi:hypothetical protein